VVQNLKIAESSVFIFYKLFGLIDAHREKTSEWRKAIKCGDIYSVR